MNDFYFVFDVESIGLHGEGFAVGGGVYGDEGNARWEFCFCCPTDTAEGLMEDRKWVENNIPTMEITHRSPLPLRMAFWDQWEKAKEQYPNIIMAGECIWPVEANFLSRCIADDAQRLKTAPYPCHDISSIMLAAGMNPMKTYDRTESEKPVHNPLADARQSARLLSKALRRINNQ
jgi:hypothetical protein